MLSGRANCQGTTMYDLWIWTILSMMASKHLTVCFGVSVMAHIGGDVLLPCHCPLNQEPYLVWQKGDTIANHYTNGNYNTETAPQYRNRTRLFLQTEEGNCSLLIRSVCLSDGGTYICYYKKRKALDYDNLMLEVAANYTSVCSSSNYNTPGIYHCEARGGYPEGRIQWKLNGQPIPGPPISQSHKDDHTDLYNLNSTLTINVTGNETLTCEVQNPKLQGVTNKCEPAMNKPPQKTRSHVALAVSGILLVLAVLSAVPLLMYFHRDRHRRSKGFVHQEEDLPNAPLKQSLSE